ncbi:MAG: universal stress protein [Streptosporangiaceae bacterium]
MKHIPAGRRIVVGVDGSKASAAGLCWAAKEAGLRRAALHVVHAWDGAGRHRAPYAPLGGLASPEEDRAAAALLLAAIIFAALGPATPVPLRAELAEGRAERVLLDRAAGAELLVLGSTGCRGHLQDALGPVHRACLRSAPCPVVIVGGAVKASAAPARAAGVKRVANLTR